MNDLIPIEGAWVCPKSEPDKIGLVTAVSKANGHSSIEVDFGPAGKGRLALGDWRCGLRPGFLVNDIPLSNVRKPLGAGTVVEIRELASREQALVQLRDTGATVWLPFERLRRLKDPALLYRGRRPESHDAAERTALNIVGHALKDWNEATGALDRLDVDPLPHQIALVHHILHSGQTNWLIADDVGLGKTIEVGLLLAALEKRQNVRRILFVVPSGLAKQWKSEMAEKFGRTFLIYGENFRIQDAREWGLYESVIIPLDTAKPRNGEDDGTDPKTTFGKLMAGGTWDLIVFDEAHRLAKGEQGNLTLRFRLAEALRRKTDALLLLSATPHQGDSGKFRNLLALVRPDLRASIDQIDYNPDVVAQIVLRNRKIDAVDIHGNFLFKGLKVSRVEIASDPTFVELEADLMSYLKKGYEASEVDGNPENRAIGFVMTVYRKIASSSVGALYLALKRRFDQIDNAPAQPTRASEPGVEPLDPDDNEDDERRLIEQKSGGRPFFAGEADLLRKLVIKAHACTRSDQKARRFIELVQQIVLQQNLKVVIFTEYRGTQDYIVDLLKHFFGDRSVTINGSQTPEQRQAAVQAFENEAQILVSTEAGGEGLNLHHDCHVMINYDLPWNPSKLVQRIGRLYRYGQPYRVMAFNFHARDTIDNQIVATLMERVETIVTEMSGVSAEFAELTTVAAEIMGELLERVDLGPLLEEARNGHVDRTQERIDAALEEAKKAKHLQDEILNFADRLDLRKAIEGSYSTEQVATILKRALPFLNIDIEDGLDVERFTLRLPAEMRGQFPEFGGRTVVPVTTRRRDWRPGGDRILLDFSTSFVRFIVTAITAADFGGGYASFESPDLPDQFWVFRACYQNDQGKNLGEKIVVLERDGDKPFTPGNRAIRALLAGPQGRGEPRETDAETRRSETDSAFAEAANVMASDLSRFRHPGDLVLIAVGESTEA